MSAMILVCVWQNEPGAICGRLELDSLVCVIHVHLAIFIPLSRVGWKRT